MNNTTYINKISHTPTQFLHALLDVAKAPEKFDAISFEHPSSNHPAVIAPAKDLVSDLHVIASAYKHGREITITRKPERVAKMPDAPVFWVRCVQPGALPGHRLVTYIDGENMAYSSTRGSGAYPDNRLKLSTASKGWEWSPDRKNWFNFYGEPVKS